MELKDKLNLMKMRYEKMCESPKDNKCPGAKKALFREIRNLENKINTQSIEVKAE